MASIEKRGERSWRLVVEAGYDANGNRIKKTKTVKVDDESLLRTTKKLKDHLELELSLFRNEVESGIYFAPEKMTVKAFFEKWNANFVQTNLEHKTRENYLFHMNTRILPELGHMKMEQVKTMHIMDFLKSLSSPGIRKDGKSGALSPAYIVYAYRVLRSFFTKAVEWKVINTNPMDGIKKPKEEHRILNDDNVFNEQEVTDLFSALENEPFQWRMMISLALTTGMRRGELIGLEWKHIDLERGVIDIRQSIPMFVNGQAHIKMPKTKNSIRKISLPQSIVEELRKFRTFKKRERMENANKWKADNAHDFVFCHINGLPLSQNRPTKWWNEFFKRNQNLKHIRFHDIRHTSTTLLINQGVHAKIIQSRLGHASITTTMNVYGHIIESADQAAANIFDSFFKSKAST